jgi:hypothetical protein
MNQAIDPVRLKAAAEHLEWVLLQYPDSDDVQALLHALTLLIDGAKTGRIERPLEREDVPGAYNFTDGLYIPYKNPSVGDAYTQFRIELRGGLTEEEKQLHAEMDSYRRTLQEDKP